MLIGWAKKDLTWNENLMLAGHHSPRQAQSVLDNLYATAVAIDDTVICSLDYINVPDEVVNGVSTNKNLILIATHNHSGYDWDLAPSAYKTFALAQIQDCIDECVENRVEGTVAWGWEQLSIACQKRIVYANENNASDPGMKYVDKNRANFSYYDGGVDEKISCVFTYVNNQLTGMLLNVPCPAQCSEWLNQVSADYWTNVRADIAIEFGNNVYILPMCGPAGEVAPELLRYDKAEERKAKLMFNVDFDAAEAARDHTSASYLARILCSRRIISKQILDAVKKAYNWCKDIRISDDFNYKKKTIAIGAYDYELSMNWTPEDYYREAKKAQLELANGTYELPSGFNPITADVVTLSNDKISFVFSGFEIYTNYGLRIQEQINNKEIIISQLAGLRGTGYLADNLNNKVYSGKESRLLGPVGAHVYCLTATGCDRQANLNPADYETMPYEENSLLNDLPLYAAEVEKTYLHVVKELDGSYTINRPLVKNQATMYKLFDINERNLNEDYVILEAGTYRLSGCQVRLTTLDGEEKYYYGYDTDWYTPEWNEFTIHEPMVLNRIGLYVQCGKVFNDYNVTPKFEKVVF